MIKQTPASRQASLQNTIAALQTIQTQSQGAIEIDVTPIVEALVDATPDMENVDDIITSIDEHAQRDIRSLERSQMPEIKVRDPHMELIQVATIQFQENQQQYPPEVQQLFQQYVEKHLKYIQAQKEIAAMSAPQIPQPNESINFKDLPPEGQAQMAKQAGIDIGAQNPQAGLPGATSNLGNIVGGQGGQ
jgi:hypothetical protein